MGTHENLMLAGMQFVSLAFEDTYLLPNRVARSGGMANLFQVYGVIAPLALPAAAHELEKSLLPASAISE
jgi:glutamate--cysteine ligase